MSFIPPSSPKADFPDRRLHGEVFDLELDESDSESASTTAAKVQQCGLNALHLNTQLSRVSETDEKPFSPPVAPSYVDFPFFADIAKESRSLSDISLSELPFVLSSEPPSQNAVCSAACSQAATEEAEIPRESSDIFETIDEESSEEVESEEIESSSFTCSIPKEMDLEFEKLRKSCQARPLEIMVEKIDGFLKNIEGQEFFKDLLGEFERAFDQAAFCPAFCQKFFAASMESRWSGIAGEYLKAYELLHDLSLSKVLACLRQILEQQAHAEEQTLTTIFKQVCRTKIKLSALEFICERYLKYDPAQFFEKAAADMLKRDIEDKERQENAKIYVLPAGFAGFSKDGVVEPGHAMFVVFIKRDQEAGPAKYSELIINAQASEGIVHTTYYDSDKKDIRQNQFSVRSTLLDKLDERLRTLLKWGNSTFVKTCFEQSKASSFSNFEKVIYEEIYLEHGEKYREVFAKENTDLVDLRKASASVKVQGQKNNCAWLACVGLMSFILRLDGSYRNVKGKPIVEKILIRWFRRSLSDIVEKVAMKPPLLALNRERFFSYKPAVAGLKALVFNPQRLNEQEVSICLERADFCKVHLPEKALVEYRGALKKVLEQVLVIKKLTPVSADQEDLGKKLLSVEVFLQALFGILDMYYMIGNDESFKRLIKELEPYENSIAPSKVASFQKFKEAKRLLEDGQVLKEGIQKFEANLLGTSPQGTSPFLANNLLPQTFVLDPSFSQKCSQIGKQKKRDDSLGDRSLLEGLEDGRDFKRLCSASPTATSPRASPLASPQKKAMSASPAQQRKRKVKEKATQSKAMERSSSYSHLPNNLEPTVDKQSKSLDQGLNQGFSGMAL